jgi:hypothetical protein
VEQALAGLAAGRGLAGWRRPRSAPGGAWDALEKWFADEGFRGSYVANVAIELRARPGHPAQAVVAAHRAALRELLEDLLTGAGPPPAAAALQLRMLIDGAVAAAAVDHQPGAASGARLMATGLLADQRRTVGALPGR